MEYVNYELENIIEQDSLDKFTSMTLLICCNNCSEMLFTNQEISSFYIKSVDDFYLIVDIKQQLHSFNVSSNTDIIYRDSFIEDKDLGYSLILCPECKSTIGCRVMTASIEKFFLIEKVLISYKQIYSVSLDKTFCYSFYLKQLFKNSYIIKSLYENNLIIQQVEDNYSQLLKDFDEFQNYKALMESLENSKQFIEKLTTIARINKFI
jgi:hypothetical protein